MDNVPFITSGQLAAKRLKQNKIALTHGATSGKRKPEYIAWCNMKARCYQINNSKYATYGAKGIVVCERWLNSFANFFEDMGVRPTSMHSIDRIDSTGNYEPTNCRWLDKQGQSNNRPGFVRAIEYNGQTMSMSAWARQTGINRETIKDRLNSGWSVEKSLTTKTREV